MTAGSAATRAAAGSAAAHAAPVACVAFRADGRRLASGAENGGVLVWDVADGSPVTAFAHRSGITAVAWNPAAAELLAAGTADGTAAVWRVVDDRPAHVTVSLPAHPGPISSVAWTPDGQHLLCVFASEQTGGRAAVWNVMSETYLGELLDCVRLAISPDGLVATVAGDGTPAVRDPWRSTDEARRPRAEAAIIDCSWSADGLLALARADGVLEVTSPYLEATPGVAVGDGALRGVTWSAGGPLTGGGSGLLGFDAQGYVRWRAPIVLPRPGTLAASGSLVAVATGGARPYLLTLSDDAKPVRGDGTAQGQVPG